ncbi:MAG: hypothetical protein ACHQ51_08755 [Elusimicrobiota bacterium]
MLGKKLIERIEKNGDAPAHPSIPEFAERRVSFFWTLASAVVFLTAPVSAATPGGVHRIVFFSSDSKHDRWPRELEGVLADREHAGLYVVVPVPDAGDDAALLKARLDRYEPQMILSRRAPSSALSAEASLRGAPLMRAPESVTEAASVVLERAGDGTSAAAPAAGVYRRLALAHLEFADDQGAMLNLLRALERDAADGEAALLLVDLQRRAGILRQALHTAERLQSIPGLSGLRLSEALRKGAGIRTILGDVAGAERDYKRALELDPSDAEAGFRLAQLLRDRPREALEYAEPAGRAALPVKVRAAAFRLAGESRLDLGEIAEGRASLIRALELSPDDLDALQDMVRLERARPQEAASYAERAQRAAEAAPPWLRRAAYRASARVWLEIKDHRRAAANLRSALALDPDDLDVLEALAQIKRERPDALSAVAGSPVSAEPWTRDALLAALKSDPQDLAALSRLISMEIARRRPAQAAVLAGRFEDAIADAPAWQQAAAYRRIPLIWLELGDAGRARNSLQAGREWDQRSVETELVILKVLGPEGSRPDPRTAGSLGFFPAEAYVAVARAHAELGDHEQARLALRRALEFDPAYADARRMLETLR